MPRRIRKNFYTKKRLGQNREITPDEIFLDSSNLPDFDTNQFEGRLEKPISKKVLLSLFLFFLVAASVFSYRLWFLQVKKGEAYLSISEGNRLRNSYIFSNRGVVYDRNGEKLVINTVNPNDENFSKRKYIFPLSHSQVLGYVKYPTKDNFGVYWETSFVGREGVESYFSDVLLGQNGLQIVEIDALGKAQSQSLTRQPRDGENLVLSIDSRIQDELFNIISSAVNQFRFQGGAGIIMDVRTGEILSLVSFPTYDSQVLTDGADSTAISEYLQNQKKPFLNRAISGLYVPGSILKPFIAVAALEENIIDPSKEILSTGRLLVPNPYFPGQFSTFTDWKAHGLVNLTEALAYSSNIYFYHIGGGFGDQKGLGISRMEKYLRLFGISEKSGINLPGEKFGVIPNPDWKKENFDGDEWRLGDTYNASIGQYGFQVTPIQVLRGIAALANGGYLLEPTILFNEESIVSEANKIDLKQRSLNLVKEGMRKAVQEGTASGLSNEYVNIAAKTGTAEVGKQSLNSWIGGFFPYEKPRYAFVVVMESGPRNNTIGGVYVMRRLLDWMNFNTPEYFN